MVTGHHQRVTPDQVTKLWGRSSCHPFMHQSRMAKSDLAARPIYARTRDSIEAHLSIVFAALAVSKWIEDTTGWSIKRFVKTTRRYRTIEITVGDHTVSAADPLPDELDAALHAIKAQATGH